MTQKEEELARIRESLKVFRQREAELSRDLGQSTVTDYTAAIRTEDEAAYAFDRLSPAEKVDLYTNDHEQWQKLLKAKESVGARKLFGGR